MICDILSKKLSKNLPRHVSAAKQCQVPSRRCALKSKKKIQIPKPSKIPVMLHKLGDFSRTMMVKIPRQQQIVGFNQNKQRFSLNTFYVMKK